MRRPRWDFEIFICCWKWGECGAREGERGRERQGGNSNFFESCFFPLKLRLFRPMFLCHLPVSRGRAHFIMFYQCFNSVGVFWIPTVCKACVKVGKDLEISSIEFWAHSLSVTLACLPNAYLPCPFPSPNTPGLIFVHETKAFLVTQNRNRCWLI